MKILPFTIFAFALLLSILLDSILLRGQKYVSVIEDIQLYYTPGEWRTDESGACFTGNDLEGVAYSIVSGSFTFPMWGYPMKSKLVAGLNDTAQVEIFLDNRTDKPYSLVGKKIETWFKPRVFRMDDRLATGIAWRDSTDLGYRIRGWRLGRQRKMQAQDTIPAWFQGTWSLVMDVWKLPQGHYSLCIDTTKEVPDGFVAQPGGDNYEYYEAHDMADTINAYEGCFWRMVYDSNYTAAKGWIDKMILADSATVPGWMLRGLYYDTYVRDTVQTKYSWDRALHFMDTHGDPAMPDSTKRPLFQTEKNYVEWCRQQIVYERGRYAP